MMIGLRKKEKEEGISIIDLVMEKHTSLKNIKTILLIKDFIKWFAKTLILKEKRFIIGITIR